jgi:hypothetical protein
MAVEHPRWQCPCCRKVMLWFGTLSHGNHCRGEEPWREVLRRTAE